MAMAGNQLTSACCQALSLLQSPLESRISTLNVLDCYLKLSGLEGQGQWVASHGRVFPLLLGCWNCTADAAVGWLWTLCLMLYLPCCHLGQGT